MPPAPPASTYRLQLAGEVRLDSALAAVPYLHALGVGALYLSPVSAARAGSTHGYDVIDPTRVNPALGDEEELRALAAALTARGMGILLDIVPNHAAATAANPAFRDVLARGKASPWAAVFDIDWRPTGPGGRAQLLLPVLGGRYGEVLERGEIRIVREDGEPWVAYYDHRFPLSESSRAELAAEGPPVSGPDHLHAVLEEQAYRLADWHVASERVNYRRFFDISDLVGLCMEHPPAFDWVHELPLRLAQGGVLHGLRIDHIDGLRDPTGYLERLQRALVGDEAYARGERFWVVVEKILSGDEELPHDWPVAGTTGYEFSRAVAGVLVDADGLDRLGDLYHRFAHRPARFADLLLRQKRRMLDELFAGEMQRRGTELCALAERDRIARDLSYNQLREALAEVTAAFPVYRTYLRDLAPGGLDRARIADTVAEVRARRPDLDPAVLDFVQRVLGLDGAAALDEEEAAGWLAFVLRWQQLTGPLMAKGLEDTALYQYNRLLSLNMVGGEPDPPRDHFTADAFHRHQARQQRRWSGGLLATSTHDSKRSEDVRCRLHVLPEITDVWRRALWLWSRQNQRHRVEVHGALAPDRNEELSLYQTLVGAWPLDPAEEPGFRERLRRYLTKALREAKVHTSWIQQDPAYEEAVLAFADAILDEEKSGEFLADLRRMVERIALPGAVNSLAQLAIKLASPGVADFYQGTELWTLTLVDPDNRSPVDLGARAAMLAALEEAHRRDPLALCREVCRTWKDGRIKMLVTWRGLQARRADPALWAAGAYLPLEVRGRRAGHVLAFARHAEGRWLVCVVPRGPARLAAGFPLGGRVWRDTEVVLAPDMPARYTDAVSGAVVRADHGVLQVAAALRALPVALLTAGAPA